MYKQVKSPKFFLNEDGKKREPVASMKCKFGGVIHIWEDDSCYIVYYPYKDRFKPTTYLCAEVIDFLYHLPKLRSDDDHWLIGSKELLEDF